MCDYSTASSQNGHTISRGSHTGPQSDYLTKRHIAHSTLEMSPEQVATRLDFVVRVGFGGVGLVLAVGFDGAFPMALTGPDA